MNRFKLHIGSTFSRLVSILLLALSIIGSEGKYFFEELLEEPIEWISTADFDCEGESSEEKENKKEKEKNKILGSTALKTIEANPDFSGICIMCFFQSCKYLEHPTPPPEFI